MKSDTRSFYVQAAQRVIEHAAAHLDEAVALDRLAAEACLSPYHFHRVFRGIVGETPLELIRRLRMERAAHRLAHSDQSVTSIAFDAGYDTHEAFTRAFRASYATSPTGFRQRKHPRIELAAPCGVHYDAQGSIPRFIPRDFGGRSMDVEIKNLPALRVAAVRHIGPYLQINEAFERLGQIAGRAGLIQPPDTEMVALFYDDPDSTPADQLRSDAGITVPPNATLPAGLTEHHVPAGAYASTVHVGPYEQLGDAWARLMGEWLPSSGRRINGDAPSYEVYLNTPMTVPKNELRTEIRIPLVS
ncbi:MAG: Transcriptional regulator, AraC family [Gemmatimonadetes bacterium]|nr:Transcriptional regulator, AraC family [Gemmatimonadota bacterium]